MHTHPLSPSVRYNCKSSFGVKAIAQTLKVNLWQTNKLFKKSRMKNKIKPAMRCKPAAGNIPDRESPTAHSDRPHICTWATPPTGCSPRVTECTGEAKGRPRPLMVTLVSPRTPPLSLPSTAGRQTGKQDTSTQPSHTLSFLPGPKAPPALPSSLHTLSQALVL